MAVTDGQTTWTLFDRRSLRPPFANAHRPRLQNMQPAVGKGLPSLTDFHFSFIISVSLIIS